MEWALVGLGVAAIGWVIVGALSGGPGRNRPSDPPGDGRAALTPERSPEPGRAHAHTHSSAPAPRPLPPDERRLQELAESLPEEGRGGAPEDRPRVDRVLDEARRLVSHPDTSKSVAARAQRLVWAATARKTGFAPAAPEYAAYLQKLTEEHDSDYAARAGVRQAEAAAQDGRFSEAAAIAAASLKTFAADDRRAAEFLLLLARAAAAQGNRDRAVDYCETLLTGYPAAREAAEALHLLGTSELERRNFGRAREFGEELERRFPNSRFAAEGRALVGRSLESAGRIDEARTVYEDGLKRFAGTTFLSPFFDGLERLNPKPSTGRAAGKTTVP